MLRRLVVLGTLPLLAAPLAACTFATDDGKPGVTGTGSGNSRSYQVADFTKLALRGGDDVDVRVGSAFSVRAEGDADVLDYLKIEKDGDTLKIGRRHRAGFSWGGKSVKVYVTMPRVTDVALAGSGDLMIDRVEGAKFESESAGSGTVSIATLAVEEAEFEIAGSGGIRAAGTARRIKIDIAGSGDVAARGLKTAAADISIAGSGSVAMAVAGDADVSIMGSGDVDLGPAARCKVSKMGSGNVRCAN